MITVTSKGSFSKTESFLNRKTGSEILSALEHHGALGVAALAAATPVDEGTTANSWSFKVVQKNGRYGIVWTNSNDAGGVPVAILLQYGHGTGTGGYVQGYDYIMPAIRPVFDQIASEVWKVVTK